VREAGVVEIAIDAAELARDALDECQHRSLVSDVAHAAGRVLPQRRDCLLQSGLIKIHEHDTRALRDEPLS
jgi:hypothetical protein